ncbi:hypothetical protein LINGRAHAP2_LOCUS23247 [Linum grandiflorum]
MQRGPRFGVPEVFGPVREDQGTQPQLPFLRAAQPTCPLPLPSPTGMGFP